MTQAVNDQNLTSVQIMQLTRAMLSVAVIDGLHPAETALIRQFYESGRNEDMPTADSIIGDDATRNFNVSDLAGSAPDFADTMVLMCLMTGYADGNLSDAEHKHIQSIGHAMGVSETQFNTHLARVQDELIGALSHLPDSGSVAKVYGELSVGG
ncbi:MAG: hypothetical protein V4568_19135 [Pseudomonadota bacterium]